MLLFLILVYSGIEGSQVVVFSLRIRLIDRYGVATPLFYEIAQPLML